MKNVRKGKRRNSCGQAGWSSIWGWAAIAVCLAIGTPPRLAAQSIITPPPAVHLSSRVVADPLGSPRPRAVPGAVIEYEIAVSNLASATLADNIFTVTSPVPAHLMLIVSPARTALAKAFDVVDQGGGPTGCMIAELGSTQDCIEFSDNGGRSFDYVPHPGSDGVDSRVTHLRFKIRTDGMPASTDIARLLLRFRMIME